MNVTSDCELASIPLLTSSSNRAGVLPDCVLSRPRPRRLASARFPLCASQFFRLRHAAFLSAHHREPTQLQVANRYTDDAAKWEMVYSNHGVAIRMLFYTGMREGELLGLQWQEIDWPRNLIDLRRTVAFRKGRLIINTPKSGKLRAIDVPASLTRDLYGHFIPGADRHHVKGLAEAIEEAGRQSDATQAQQVLTQADLEHV